MKELARADHADAGKAGGHAKAGTSTDGTRQTSPYAEALEDQHMTEEQKLQFLIEAFKRGMPMARAYRMFLRGR